MNAAVQPVELRRVPIFASLDEATLVSLSRCVRRRVIRVADALYREGDPGDSMAFVLEGELVARVHLDHGGELEIETIAVGGVVGEMVCFEPARRSATVAAVAPTVVAELGRDALAGLRLGAPEIYARLARRVIDVVSKRLRQVNDRIDAELEEEALRSGTPLTTEVPRAPSRTERPPRDSGLPPPPSSRVGSGTPATERPDAPRTPTRRPDELRSTTQRTPERAGSNAPPPPSTRGAGAPAPAEHERTTTAQGFARLLDRLMNRSK